MSLGGLKKVAVVTGSNKGVGFGIVRALCKQFDGDVYLTARDEERGRAAADILVKEGLTPKFHQLDITDTSSIERLKTFLSSIYGGLDVLVNNAAIAYKFASPAPFAEQAEVTFRTNFWGTYAVCQSLFPILRPHARVVNISSNFSESVIKDCSPPIQSRFKDPNITITQLEKLVHEFVQSAQSGTHEEAGFPQKSYGMTSVCITAMSYIQQREFSTDAREDIVVNACNPGRVRTDMSSGKGTKSIDEGADTPVYLALLPPNVTEPKGNYVCDRQILYWD